MPRKNDDLEASLAAFQAGTDAARVALGASIKAATEGAINSYLAGDETAPFPARVEISFNVTENLGTGAAQFNAFKSEFKFKGEK